MKEFDNKKETSKIGAQIRALRKKAGLSINDISDMTGFTQSSLSAIENGGETRTSHLVEIAKAIGVHPSEIFNIPFLIKPRYKLGPKRQARNRLTYRVNKLYEDGDFFNAPALVNDVIRILQDKYDIKTKSSAVSQILKRMASEGKLKYSKIGRQNSYIRSK